MGAADRSRVALVEAYWRYRRLGKGDRSERLAADADWWAVEAVARAVDDGDADVLDTLDALMRANESDLVFVGGGPLEDLLVGHPEFAEQVATLCRTDAVWNAAVRSVSLDSGERERLLPLWPFLATGVE